MTDDSFKDQSILITGGSGSFGQRFAERVLKEDLFKKVVIFSRDEWKQSEMRDRSPLLRHPKIRYFIGDVRDKSRLERAFSGIDIVIHAAALKQVPVAEYNPSEFVNTNIVGAMNVVDAAIRQGVKKAIALSTDKAVSPTNLYGATKLCQDRIFIASNAYVGEKGHPIFSVVRYGNVAGSRGSVIPIWERQIREGAKSVALTDPRMTRFWISLDEAVTFVLNTLKTMKGGEIFVPKIPSFTLLNLKEAMAPHLETKIIGLREGEKLHEALVSEDEARHTLEDKGAFTILPIRSFRENLPSFDNPLAEKGKTLQEGFSYTSDKNPHFLEVSEIKDLLTHL